MTNIAASPTFVTVQNIIAETCDIPLETITPESHTIDDLGIDSLDALDIFFAIDKAFGIKLPLEKWTELVNDGKATTDQYFVVKNMVKNINILVEKKKQGIPPSTEPQLPPEVIAAYQARKNTENAESPQLGAGIFHPTAAAQPPRKKGKAKA